MKLQKIYKVTKNSQVIKIYEVTSKI